MMTIPELQKYITSAVSQAGGDDLERARYAFNGLSPEQMNEQYGHSGQTRREILEGYERHRAKHNEVVAYLAELFKS